MAKWKAMSVPRMILITLARSSRLVRVRVRARARVRVRVRV